ncbi:hypothetical protein SAMN05443244_2658 [Terriglobus roseus]|uniref:Uncharacterized protein n=1 Tax=Terriglobus roseus TaxID=392734 RepID=A0A1H4PSN4_9BACT|nr:hypothetical protein SAMN05443244_2658 [Terriglobus roseus]
MKASILLAWSVAIIRFPRLRMLTVPVLLGLDPNANLESLHF